MCLEMLEEEQTALKPFGIHQTLLLSIYSAGNINYHYIISYLDSLQTAKCSREIRADLYHIK